MRSFFIVTSSSFFRFLGKKNPAFNTEKQIALGNVNPRKKKIVKNKYLKISLSDISFLLSSMYQEISS